MEGEEIEGGHFGQVRRLRGVILEGEVMVDPYPGLPRKLAEIYFLVHQIFVPSKLWIWQYF